MEIPESGSGKIGELKHYRKASPRGTKLLINLHAYSRLTTRYLRAQSTKVIGLRRSLRVESTNLNCLHLDSACKTVDSGVGGVARCVGGGGATKKRGIVKVGGSERIACSFRREGALEEVVGAFFCGG
ncbi:hypothetical protein GN958_ATG13696 [Phytophthora infestans]|uniref:Uncharacterized protein n=1 Tax=Phytophthora infestans TaxID=4787 RepID=A0A8S9UCA1_PHYIN|nr:hypothetical protein GN958_ATG13696 [Phytophthora infestans]